MPASRADGDPAAGAAGRDPNECFVPPPVPAKLLEPKPL